VWKALKFKNAPAPYELIKWNMIERFHWSLEEWYQMSLQDLKEFVDVETGRLKAKPPGKGKGRR
jgi:hypothetical protein